MKSKWFDKTMLKITIYFICSFLCGVALVAESVYGHYSESTWLAVCATLFWLLGFKIGAEYTVVKPYIEARKEVVRLNQLTPAPNNIQGGEGGKDEAKCIKTRRHGKDGREQT